MIPLNLEGVIVEIDNAYYRVTMTDSRRKIERCVPYRQPVGNGGVTVIKWEPCPFSDPHLLDAVQLAMSRAVVP